MNMRPGIGDQDEPVGAGPTGSALGTGSLREAVPVRQAGATGRKIVVLVTDLAQSANREFADGAARAAMQQGVVAVVVAAGTLPTDLRGQLFHSMTRRDGVDGVVVSCHSTDAALTSWLRDLDAEPARSPIVTVGVALNGARRIVPDVEDGVRQAVHHLVEVHECRHLVLVKEQDVSDGEAAVDLPRVYRDVLSEHGLSAAQALIVDAANSQQGGSEAMTSLLQKNVAIDAVVVSRAAMAAGVHEALDTQGLRVPEDVAIVALEPGDFVPLRGAPSLTAVAPSSSSLGDRAVSALLRWLEGQDYGRGSDWDSEPVAGSSNRLITEVDELLPAELLLRHSCGCSPAPAFELGRHAPDDGVLLDFARELMVELSREGLCRLMDLYFPKLGVEHAFLVSMASPGAWGSREDSMTSSADPLTLAYVDGHATILRGGSGRGKPKGLWQALGDSSGTTEPFALVGLPLLCGEATFGLMLAGPWDSKKYSLYRAIADSVAGLLFREREFTVSQGLQQRVDTTLGEMAVTKRIMDRVQQAPDTEAVLRITLEELSAVLGASEAVARLGTLKELLAVDGGCGEG